MNQLLAVIDDYKQCQAEFIEFEIRYKKELQKVKNDVKTLENSMKFIHSLTMDNMNDEGQKLIQPTIESIVQLSNSIKENSKANTLKKEYNSYRQKMNTYFEFIKRFNNFNLGQLCTICLTNRVTHFSNPCGHTYCKTCSDKLTVDRRTQQYDANCFLCRKVIHSIHPLYFL